MSVVSPPPGFRGRHANAAPPPPAVWRCVRCSAENSGPLEAGCAHCGSGAPGVHLEPSAVQSTQVHVPTDPPPAADTTSVDEAFTQWRKTRPELESAGWAYLYEAFKAGYEMAQTAIVQAPALSGTAESRTIVAALRVFKESILPTAQEEIVCGEFLDGPSIDRLITRLERSNG